MFLRDIYISLYFIIHKNMAFMNNEPLFSDITRRLLRSTRGRSFLRFSRYHL